MKVIARGRGQGKTTELVLESARTGRYILVYNRGLIKNLLDRAEQLGVSIPYPVTVEEIRQGKFYGSSLRRDGIIVDDAEIVLERLLRIPLTMISVSVNE